MAWWRNPIVQWCGCLFLDESNRNSYTQGLFVLVCAWFAIVLVVALVLRGRPKQRVSSCPPPQRSLLLFNLILLLSSFYYISYYRTMLMNQILDSSNSLRGPDERSRPLKRSASVASLPTPPRTHHKRSRSRARSSVSHHDSDDSGSASELDDDLAGGYTERIKRVKTTTRNTNTVSDNDELSEEESPERKKRRTLGVLPGHDEDEEDENAFWTGRVAQSRGEKQEKRVAEADKKEESSPSPALLRYRVKAPVSPPPSRRQPLIQPARAASVEREDSSTDSAVPVTPPRRLFLRAPSPSAAGAFKTPTKSKATKIWPKRDSPNNPFLVDSSEQAKLRSEWDSSDDEAEEVVGEALVREGTPTPTYEEKPTITYVL